ncbi:hypothetical protein GCM10011519_22210 [Marmoricola endophyticus]|uniref:Sulfotransferase family protein n=1 Tax=Marmoricola endophyticus TaxID=2040280 RepID=A0A917BJ19_9ACTN|nr:hypothetical protein [Marmoricola endophyticus]GGF47725.1 hypothetical protein GCM10011519_22210 [Marmoricola endophyticus]
MTRRVFVHVGAPKTGTTYLQATMAANRSLLAGHGVTYPSTSISGNHFDAAIDLIDHRWGGRLEQARGHWDRLAGAATKTPGDAVISHEVLAAATAEQASKARGLLADREVHIVYTARDLARQIPAEWQETVKHRGRQQFRRFVADLAKDNRTHPSGWFWKVQGLPAVLERWGDDLPREHVHLITVPAAGSPPDVLWDRFASVVGLPADLDLEAAERSANASLGTAETALMRHLNIALKGRSIPQPVYATTVRELLARDVLGPRKGTLRATVPPRFRSFVEEVTTQWRDWIAASGIDVVGDVDELTPQWDDPVDWVDPDKPPAEDVLDSAVQSIAKLVELEADRYRSSTPRKLRRRLGL